MLTKDSIKDAPRTWSALRDQHMVAGKGNDVYVAGSRTASRGRYAVVHVGERLNDPENGKILGYMGIYAASVRVDESAR